MPRSNPLPAAILEALGEPALIVDRNIVVAANAAAKAVLGTTIVDRDVRARWKIWPLRHLIPIFERRHCPETTLFSGTA